MEEKRWIIIIIKVSMMNHYRWDSKVKFKIEYISWEEEEWTIRFRFRLWIWEEPKAWMWILSWDLEMGVSEWLILIFVCVCCECVWMCWRIHTHLDSRVEVHVRGRRVITLDPMSVDSAAATSTDPLRVSLLLCL